MKKKLQVFISSTYMDLIEERQAAVEAVLSAGHIPAGMELFKAGDETQKETIKKWIDESDVYVLLVGGRYGSIEPKSGLSYTQWEYEYAGQTGKPRFSLVMTREALERKVREKGSTVLEVHNNLKFEQFKEHVLGKTSEFFDDIKDIKLSIIRKMAESQSDENLVGWVSGRDVKSNETLATHVAKLTSENELLKQEITFLRKKNKDFGKDAASKKISDSHSDEEFNVNIQEKFYERLDRVLKLKRINSFYSLDETIEWTSGKNEYSLGFPNGKLSPYLKKSKEGNIEKLIILGRVKKHYDYNSALGDIRVTLSQYDIDNNMDVLFLIAHPANQPAKKEQALKFFEKVKDQIENKTKFDIEFWDEQSLSEIEKELLLKL